MRGGGRPVQPSHNEIYRTTLIPTPVFTEYICKKNMFQFFYSRAGASWNPDKDTPDKRLHQLRGFQKNEPFKAHFDKTVWFERSKRQQAKKCLAFKHFHLDATIMFTWRGPLAPVVGEPCSACRSSPSRSRWRCWPHSPAHNKHPTSCKR